MPRTKVTTETIIAKVETIFDKFVEDIAKQSDRLSSIAETDMAASFSERLLSEVTSFSDNMVNSSRRILENDKLLRGKKQEIKKTKDEVSPVYNISGLLVNESALDKDTIDVFSQKHKLTPEGDTSNYVENRDKHNVLSGQKRGNSENHSSNYPSVVILKEILRKSDLDENSASE